MLPEKRPCMRWLSILCAGLIASAMTACSGGNAPGSQTVPRVAAPVRTHKVKATIRIAIPKRKHHRRRSIRGHYVSSATQSIAIAITPSGGSPASYNEDLTVASNPNCTESLISPLICTINLQLAPGSYTATFATYDGLLSSGRPTGSELSANQSVSFSIAVGQSNELNAVLDGIPASVALVPDASSTLSGNNASGYTISKCVTAAQKVSVVGVDMGINLCQHGAV